MFLLFFLFLFKGIFSSDPCHNFDRLWDRESSLTCLKAIPFADYEETFHHIIDRLLGSDEIPYMGLYCYREHMKAGTGPPLDMKIDFYTELEDLKAKVFDSWFDAQMSLVNIFIKNRDAHTFWKSDDFFGLGAKFFHPIGISSHLNGSSQVFTVRHNSLTRGWFEAYNQAYGVSIDFESLNGKIITSIDGEPPSEAIHSFCKNHFAFSRDDGTCLNELLRDYDQPVTETWFVRFPQLNNVPGSSVSYEFEDPNTKAKQVLSIDFISCFFEASISPNCLNISSLHLLESLIAPPINKSIPSDDIPSDLKNYYHEKSTPRSLVEEKHEKTRKFLQGRIDKFFGDMDNVTVICSFSQVYVAYFFNDVPNVVIFQILSMMYTYESEMSFIQCFDKIAVTSELTKMVIDLRDNGGGVIQWGMELAIGLMKITLPSFLDMLPPLIVTETYRKYEPVKNGTNYYSDHKDAMFKEFDGSVTTYPPYARLDADEWIPLIPHDPIKNESRFTGMEPEDILIVTDGSCGSTCGMFTKFLMAMQGAKVLVYGGFVDEMIDVSSFDGASNQNILFDDHLFGYSWAGLLPFSYRGSYDRSKIDLQKLMGFQYTPPDFRVYDWDGLRWADPRLVWEAVEDFLDICVDSWSLKIDPTCEDVIEHGIYGRPCQKGVFNMSADCAIKRCEVGYYLLKDDDVDETPKSCESIHDAPVWKIFDKEQMKPNDPPGPSKKKKTQSTFLHWWGWTLIGISGLSIGVLGCVGLCCCVFGITVCFVMCLIAACYYLPPTKRVKKMKNKKKPVKTGYEEVGKEMGEF